MAGEATDVKQAETATAPESSTEDQQTATTDASTETQAAEPVDETGVPIKNRMAEADRKAKQRLSQIEAERALLSGATSTAQKGESQDQEEAIEIVRKVAREENQRALEPILAKQFLMENPDAASMIDEINQVRARYPELHSIDRLDVAYKIALAEKQEEIIRQRVEQGKKELLEREQKANQATVEGTGRTRTTEPNVADRIAGATSLADLKALETEIFGQK